MEETNYFDSMLQDVVSILNDDSIDWPVELDTAQRKALIKKLITYYETREDYEKCKRLEKVLESLND